MISAIQKLKELARFGKGKSKAALRRRAAASAGVVHSGKPGETIKMSDRSYFVARDGSFRRIPEIGVVPVAKAA